MQANLRPSEPACNFLADFEVHVALGLRVTTWNILAPIMGGDKMFPGISREIHSQDARRPVLQRQIITIGSDVLLLQEVRKAELNMLLQAGESPLNEFYESHYIPERSWLHLEHTGASDDAERGAAVLWRRGVLDQVSTVSAGVWPGGPPCVAIIHAVVVAWGHNVMFATAHLDGDAPKPALARAQEQLVQVMDTLCALGQKYKCADLIFGGDCNLTSFAPAMRKASQRNFHISSAFPNRPTCFSVLASARFDHIFMRGSLESLCTEIPSCPFRTCCPFAAFCHPSQLMVDLLGLSEPRVKLQCFLRCLVFVCLLVPWSLAVLCCFCLPFPRSWRRCQWALAEWGSDHVPVTVTFKRKTL